MIDARVFIKEPLRFKRICEVYPPSVKDVTTNEQYGQYCSIFTITQEDIKDATLKDSEDATDFLTPFEFLLNNCYNNETYKLIAIKAFEFFTHKKPYFFFEEKKIFLGDLEEAIKKVNNVDELIFLTEEDYFEFQNLIRLALGNKALEPYVEDPNEDPRITRMKKKMRERDRVKAKQGSKNGLKFSSCLAAICCMGIGITPLNIGELSNAAISPLMQMMQEKEKYQIDIRSLLAGAKGVKPKYWIRNSD